MLVPPGAQAGVFNFAFQQGDNNYGTQATGTLTTTDSPGSGSQTITDISGNWTIYIGGTPTVRNITGLFVPDTSYSSDDLLYLNGGPYLDTMGMTFKLDSASGGDDFQGDVNISYLNGTYVEPIEIGANAGTFQLSPALAATPEPVALLPLAFGLLACAFLYIRKFRSSI